MKRHGTANSYRVWRSHFFHHHPRFFEESPDLARRAIGVFPMREMSDVCKHREIEIRKCLAQAVGPGIGKQRIVLGPAHAGGHIDRRQLRGFALHHPDRGRHGPHGNAQSRRRDCRALKIVDEGFQHVVEGALAIRPVLQEMPDIGPAALACRADQRRRHLHLVERLVPDVVEPVRRPPCAAPMPG